MSRRWRGRGRVPEHCVHRLPNGSCRNLDFSWIPLRAPVADRKCAPRLHRKYGNLFPKSAHPSVGAECDNCGKNREAESHELEDTSVVTQPWQGGVTKEKQMET